MHETKPLEILVVDDDQALRNASTKMIRSTGANVTQAANGNEGIVRFSERLASAKPYDGVISDYNMPDMTGVQMGAEIKRLSPGTLVYISSGKILDAQTEAASLDGLQPDGFLEKPFKKDELLGIIAQIKSIYAANSNTQAPKGTMTEFPSIQPLRNMLKEYILAHAVKGGYNGDPRYTEMYSQLLKQTRTNP